MRKPPPPPPPESFQWMETATFWCLEFIIKDDGIEKFHIWAAEMVEGLIWPGLFPYAGISMAMTLRWRAAFSIWKITEINNCRAGSIFIPRLSAAETWNYGFIMKERCWTVMCSWCLLQSSVCVSMLEHVIKGSEWSLHYRWESEMEKSPCYVKEYVAVFTIVSFLNPALLNILCGN